MKSPLLNWITRGPHLAHHLVAWSLVLITAPAQAAPLQSAPEVSPHVFKSVNGTSLSLSVTRATQLSGDKPKPCLILYHGGGWVGGSPRVFDEQALYLAGRGIVVVQPAYRLLDKNKQPNGFFETPERCIQDARSAYRWVVAHASEFNIDIERIAVGGASAGGHLAAACAMLPGHDDPADDMSISVNPKAMILMSPVMDTGPNGYGYKRVLEKYLDYSPFHNARPGLPPTIIFMGAEDTTVSVSMIETFAQKMNSMGVRCEALVYEGKKHVFFNRKIGGEDGYQEVLYQIDKFLGSLGWIEGDPTITKPAIKMVGTK